MMDEGCDQGNFWKDKTYIFLQEINISHLGKRENHLQNMDFKKGDMLIPRRVYFF